MANATTVTSQELTAARWFQKLTINFDSNGDVLIATSLFSRGSFHAEDGTWGTLAFYISNDPDCENWEKVAEFDGTEDNFIVEFYDASYERMKITSTGYRGKVFASLGGRNR